MAISTRGRDEGRVYVIIKCLNEHLAALVDGESRKIENPKIKNLKHLKFTKRFIDEIRAVLLAGETPDNQIIRNSLKKINEAGECDGKEVW